MTLSNTKQCSTGTKGGILVIGASGRIGSQVIQHLSSRAAFASAVVAKEQQDEQLQSPLIVYGFCRDVSKVDQQTKNSCRTLFQGDARISADLERTLCQSRVNVVIVCIGNGEHGYTTKKKKATTIRSESASALVEVLTNNPSLQHVQVIVVSRSLDEDEGHRRGGRRRKSEYARLRHVLQDHKDQEAIFFRNRQAPPLKNNTCENTNYNNNNIWDRTLIVRPNSNIADHNNTKDVVQPPSSLQRHQQLYHPTVCGGKIVSYLKSSSNPFLTATATAAAAATSISTNRDDFAKWLVELVYLVYPMKTVYCKKTGSPISSLPMARYARHRGSSSSSLPLISVPPLDAIAATAAPTTTRHSWDVSLPPLLPPLPSQQQLNSSQHDHQQEPQNIHHHHHYHHYHHHHHHAQDKDEIRVMIQQAIIQTAY